MMAIIQEDNFNCKHAEKENFLKIIKNKFVVALDFDGVITCPGELKRKYINELGYHLQINEVERDICLSKGVSLEDYKKGAYRAYTEKTSLLPLEKDFKKVFCRIINSENVSVFIVSSRYDHMIPHLEEYLKFHKIKVDGIIAMSEKNKIEGLKQINAHIFFDDSISKLKDILYHDPEFYRKCSLVLFRNNQNINRVQDSSKIEEVTGWKELENFFEKIKSGK